MLHFSDKTVVITGAGSGIGRAFAIEFAKLGAKLALNDYDDISLAATVRLLGGVATKGIYAEAFDVSDAAAMRQFAQNSQKALGAAHVVINNAGIGGSGRPVWATDDETYERTLRINFFGVVNGTRAFLPQLMGNVEAALVNISSAFGLVGMPNHSDYCASKFAVRGFTEALMVELTGSNVAVHLVHPGGIRTNIASGVEGGEELTENFLTTSPSDLVLHVIAGVKKGKQRIVYGNQSFSMWFSSWGMPLERRNKVIYGQMKNMFDQRFYQQVKRKLS